MQYAIFRTRWGYFGLAGTDGTTGHSPVRRVFSPRGASADRDGAMDHNHAGRALNPRGALADTDGAMDRNHAGRALNPRGASTGTDGQPGGSGKRELADGVVLRTCLPLPDRRTAEQEMLKALGPARDHARLDKNLLPDLQQRIAAYFEGENVDFSTDPAVSLDGLSPWDHKVLLTCRKVPSGRTTTYGELAIRIGHPGAARAVGSALARNPIPLIIPCHRVLRTDGHLGGFSAPGGLTTKQALLRHEQTPRPAQCAGSIGM